MNEKLDIDVKTLKPFTKFIYTIGVLPTSYLMSMTYEEQLVWLCNYLSQTIIPTINNNAEAVKEVQDLVTELQDYINNYFDNLDVGEEINNKLDEMAESGYFENIVKSYIKTFNLYISNYPKNENEDDDGERLQRIINDGIKNGNANVIIDELIHVSKKTDIQLVTGHEQLTISGYYENNANDSMFYNGSWHTPNTGILASGNIDVFEIINPSGYETNEPQGIKFSKLPIINETYERPAGMSDLFLSTINGIKYERASLIVDGCYFYGLNNAIYNPYTANAYSDNVIIKNSVFHYFINSAITLSRADGGLIENCHFVPFTNYKDCLYIRGSRAISLNANIFANWGHFINNEWVKCQAINPTALDDTGSYVIFGYDSDINSNAFHVEEHNGSAVIYAKGGNVCINTMSIPLANSKTGLSRYGGRLSFNNSTIKYVSGFNPYDDLYANGGNIYFDNSYRYDDNNDIYFLKTSSANTKSNLVSFPVLTATLRITATDIFLRQGNDTSNSQTLTMDQYGDIKIDISDSTLGKIALTSVGFGNVAYTKANISNKQVVVSLYNADGSKITSNVDCSVYLVIY